MRTSELIENDPAKATGWSLFGHLCLIQSPRAATNYDQIEAALKMSRNLDLNCLRTA